MKQGVLLSLLPNVKQEPLDCQIQGSTDYIHSPEQSHRGTLCYKRVKNKGRGVHCGVRLQVIIDVIVWKVMFDVLLAGTEPVLVDVDCYHYGWTLLIEGQTAGVLTQSGKQSN